MNNEQLTLENIRLKNELANLKAQVNRFQKFLAIQKSDNEGLTGKTILEMNLLDQFNDMVKEFNKIGGNK